MNNLVQNRCGGLRAFEQFAPAGQGDIGGKDGGPFLVAHVQQLEDQVGLLPFDGQISDFIGNQELIPGISPQHPFKSAFVVGGTQSE